MLSWAFKKGIQGATGQTDASGADEDTTQIEAPDTPAPIFAARAFKNALFGARNASEAAQTTAYKHSQPAKKKNSSSTPSDMVSPSKQSPTKQPTSILLTPGTGTARRKRVSFNHDVKAGSGVDSSPLASARQRQRTTLQRALENSRSAKSKVDVQKVEEKAPSKAAGDESEGEWEDDVCDRDVNQDMNQDMTEDLNEPQSESGKYWKAEFNRYRTEAMADIENMVKYKALAKSYAKKKDAEALELAQKLKEEQEKVAKLEEKINDLTAQTTGKRRRSGDNEDRDALLKDLDKQTALAARYRDQVKELNTLLKEYQGESKSSRSDRYRVDTSPRTEQTLFDVKLELRRARAELKEMDKLRKEVERLQAKLSAKEEEEQSRRASRHTDHERVQRKDAELRKLRRDYETLKNDAKSRTAEAMQVLQEKNDKIAELEKTIKTLELAHPSIKATRELKSSIDALGKPSKFQDAKPLRIRRSASVEDITLDMTQRSLLGNKEEQKMNNDLEKLTSETFLDWSASFKGMKNQLKKAKEEQMEANRREMQSIMEDADFDLRHSRSGEKLEERESPRTLKNKEKEKSSLFSHDTGRVMSQILASELNKSSGTRGKELFEQKQKEDREKRATARENNSSETHGALEKPASRRERPRSYGGRPSSSGGEARGFDLVHDRYARLGGSEPERSSSMSTSRCTLPPDRQAAARARLEQKKLERQRNGGGRSSRDKENVRL
ncbi:spindle pole body formation-associated protein-domain-containing protein [Hypoxylon sp. FL1857]|nr:spindle pole body formation-associated protein-domain-containing protein [Hypoxylon sp. FL1857]